MTILLPLINLLGVAFGILVIIFNPILGIALTTFNGVLLVHNCNRLQNHLEKK